jgi:Uma2 family endonuclease
MASPTRLGTHPTLEAFLALPEPKPVLAQIDGQFGAEAVPNFKRSAMTHRLGDCLDEFVETAGLAGAFPEIRDTFTGRSIVPDAKFLRGGHIEVDAEDTLTNDVNLSSDIGVDRISRDGPVTKSHEEFVHAVSHDCRLRWRVHPRNKTIDVYRLVQSAEWLAEEVVHDAEPVLPGFRLPLSGVPGWLRPPTPGTAAVLASLA